MIDLDANANVAVTPAVERAVVDAMRSGASNPSSPHRGGDAARRILEGARDAVASLVGGAYEDGVVFTSGCTEANNAVLRSFVPRGGATIVTTAVEHASVARPAHAVGCERLRILPVDRDGVCDLAVLETLLDDVEGPVLLSVQAANGETGVIQPMREIARIAARRGDVLFHSDAAQAFGKWIVELGKGVGPDVVTVSGHKLHAPMGVGAIVLAADETRVAPLLLGGGQERGLRAGTQALPAIAGLAAACRERSSRLREDVATMRGLRDALETSIAARSPGAVVNGGRAARLPNTSNLRFPGVDGAAMIGRLDLAGVLCSQGSACDSMQPIPSPTLLAMGLAEEDAHASVRFSVSPLNTMLQIASAAEAIAAAVRASGCPA